MTKEHSNGFILLMAKRKETIEKYFRDRTSKLDYGYKYQGHPIHCNKKETINEYLNYERPYLNRMTNKMFDEHFKGEKTFYFAGNESGPITLVMIDVDCHHKGTLNGAIQYTEDIKQFPVWKELMVEPSTNGNGIHAYFNLYKEGLQPWEVNELLHDLDYALYTRIEPFDIETVEIKGTLPEFTDVDNKAGQLGKYPRTFSTLDKVEDAPLLSVDELKELIAQLQITSVEKTEEIKEVKKRGDNNARSMSGKCIDVSQLPIYVQYAQLLPGITTVKTKGKKAVDILDFGINLMLTHYFSQNMNPDGSMPVARIRAMWNAMYKAGEIPRAFDGDRNAAIRNHLSQLGLIKWENKYYQLGQAAKWRLTDEVMEQLLTLTQKEEHIRASFIRTLSTELSKLVINPVFDRPTLIVDAFNCHDFVEEIENFFIQAV